MLPAVVAIALLFAETGVLVIVVENVAQLVKGAKVNVVLVVLDIA